MWRLVLDGVGAGPIRLGRVSEWAYEFTTPQDVSHLSLWTINEPTILERLHAACLLVS